MSKQLCELINKSVQMSSQIESLCLSEVCLTNENIMNLFSLTKLRALFIWIDIDDESDLMQLIKNNPRLEYLSLHNTTDLYGKCLHVLPQSVITLELSNIGAEFFLDSHSSWDSKWKLKFLTITGTTQGCIVPAIVNMAPNLEGLTVKSLVDLYNYHYLKELKNLKYLTINLLHHYITQGDIEDILENCRSLVKFSLDAQNFRFSEKVYISLSKIHQLKEMSLTNFIDYGWGYRGTRMFEELKFLSYLKNLETLIITQSMITQDEAFTIIKECKKLKLLQLTSCPVLEFLGVMTAKYFHHCNRTVPLRIEIYYFEQLQTTVPNYAEYINTLHPMLIFHSDDGRPPQSHPPGYTMF